VFRIVPATSRMAEAVIRGANLPKTYAKPRFILALSSRRSLHARRHRSVGPWHEADIASTAAIGLKPDVRNLAQTAAPSALRP